MDRGLRAVFYEYKYYLLPEGMTLDELKEKRTVTLTRLKEELCMAPNFVYESEQEETVSFDSPERIFEVTVDLYTCDEYDKILAEAVERVCRGCENYSDDGEGLDGHHREISLEGVCYERTEKDERVSFAFRVGWFWRKVAGMLGELAKCIDGGKQDRLNELLSEQMKRVAYPLRFYGTVEDGKYCLCLSSERRLPYSYNSILAYFAAAANKEDGEMTKAGWTVKPCFEQGVFRYDGKKSFGDDEPHLYLIDANFPYRYAVGIYMKGYAKLSEKKQSEIIDEVHDRIREAIGERREVPLIAGYCFGEPEGKLMSVNEAAAELISRFDGFFSDDSEVFPSAIGYAMDKPLNKDDSYPYKRFVTGGVTCIYDIELSLLDEVKADMWWSDFFTYAYIFIPKDNADEDLMNALQWYIKNLKLVPEPIRMRDDTDISALGVGGGESEDGLFLDNIVFDRKKFFCQLRSIAPVLRSCGARLITLDEGGMKEYLCDYSLIPVGNTGN